MRICTYIHDIHVYIYINVYTRIVKYMYVHVNAYVYAYACVYACEIAYLYEKYRSIYVRIYVLYLCNYMYCTWKLVCSSNALPAWTNINLHALAAFFPANVSMGHKKAIVTRLTSKRRGTLWNHQSAGKSYGMMIAILGAMIMVSCTANRASQEIVAVDIYR